jgi:hypothetical protein
MCVQKSKHYFYQEVELAMFEAGPSICKLSQVAACHLLAE